MRTLSADTPPVVERIQIEGFRRMSPAEKLRRVSDLNRAVLELARARIRKEYGPDLPEEEVRFRLASLWLDREIMIRVFGWDPARKGY